MFFLIMYFSSVFKKFFKLYLFKYFSHVVLIFQKGFSQILQDVSMQLHGYATTKQQQKANFPARTLFGQRAQMTHSQLPRRMTSEMMMNIEKAKVGRYENLNPQW